MTLQRETSQGPLAGDISNEVVRLVRQHFGKGPTQAKTVWHDDVVVTLLRGGYTTAEQTLIAAGKADLVEDARRAMQEVFEREMRAAVERITGRRVQAFMSANHQDPDLSVEIFVLCPEPTADPAHGEPPAGA